MTRTHLTIMVVVIVAWRSCFADHTTFFKEYGCPIYRMLKATEYAPAADLVVGMAALESGYGTAAWVTRTRQVFGLTENRALKPGERPIDRLLKFDRLEDAVKALLTTFRKRNFPTDPVAFVKRLDTAGYHATEDYTERLAGTLDRVNKNLLQCEVK